jgi:hypothetical protein
MMSSSVAALRGDLASFDITTYESTRDVIFLISTSKLDAAQMKPNQKAGSCRKKAAGFEGSGRMDQSIEGAV